ncbi:hypothetical protein [Microbispora sp. NPDC049633]|uniref:hypothetical protein n=1 Tax=Microbispora sp. NPDC049633 TaxID=3154355 RepID=UPI0034222312
MTFHYVSFRSRVWKDVDADRWHWKCDKPKCREGSASHWRIALFFAARHTARHHIRRSDQLAEPCCDQQGSHYHCPECGEITGMTGHHVGGSKGRTICDPVERRAFLAELAAATK